jgi:peroxiredoxin
LYNEYSDQDFIVLNVVMQDSMGSLPDNFDIVNWGNTYDLPFPVLADDGQFVDQYLAPMGESFSTYIIDPEGRVAWVEYGESPTTDDRARVEIEAML